MLFLLGSFIDIQSLAPENVFSINFVLLSVSAMQGVPIFNVKTKVDMEILVVVVMEDTVRLPGLPPQFLNN